jgi:energy-coupling factor transporter ATP-binding protein EcfA2
VEELALLVKLLREEDPAKQATALRRFAARVQAVESELALLEAPFSDQHVAKLRTAFEQLIGAEKATKIAATDLQEGGRALPGTGTDPWELLVRSAIDFATQQAYPGHPFPGPADGASCVLCQQPLSTEARERLVQFVKFLEADAQKQFSEKRRHAGDLYKAIANANIEGFPSDQVFLEEVGEFAPELVATIRTHLKGLAARQASVKTTAPNRRVAAFDALPPSPAAGLKSLRESRIAQADKLNKTLTPEQRKVKLARLADLEARQKLKGFLPTVLEAIVALKLEHALSEAVKRCNTAAVTRKINELYEKTVTAGLRTALANELAEFRFQGIKIGLEMSGQKGARMQQLKLSASGQFGRVKVSDILSEGEQRAIALASFLAEIGLEQGKSGIVFDDPVSSLDHMRREHIARRLALEAKARQVIVFTHDLAFAWSLREYAADHGVKHAERHVYAAGESKGHCAEALPFEAKKLDARVNDLRTLGARAKKALERDKDHDTYNNLVRNGYRRMRDTWELLVEDLLFAGAVKRFRRSVNTLKLRAVMVEDEDIKPVYEGMTRCSNFTHEGGAEAPPALPTPDEFIADIEALGAAVSAITTKTKAVDQRRKEAGMSA